VICAGVDSRLSGPNPYAKLIAEADRLYEENQIPELYEHLISLKVN